MRNLLLTVMSLLSVSAMAQNKRIVFVCEHGSAKSVIAAAYFNELAKEKNLHWDAVAMGINPDASISGKTKEILVKDNLFDSKFTPVKISQKDVDQSQQVILFFPLPENVQGKSKTRDWTNIQAVNEDFPRLRDDIVSRIKPLIDSLSKTKK